VTRAGALAQRVGPRWLMTAGCLLCAAGPLAVAAVLSALTIDNDVLRPEPEHPLAHRSA
jgi:hypothetical protein